MELLSISCWIYEKLITYLFYVEIPIGVFDEGFTKELVSLLAPVPDESDEEASGR